MVLTDQDRKDLSEALEELDYAQDFIRHNHAAAALANIEFAKIAIKIQLGLLPIKYQITSSGIKYG